MAKAFSSDQLAELNAKSTKGRFVEAAIFTRDQNDPDNSKEYFFRFGTPMTFQGNLYHPIDMVWDGLKVTSKMDLPTNEVVVSNLGGSVIEYLEDNSVDVNGNDVILQILLIDKFNRITLVDRMLFQLEAITADYNKAATFHLGVNWSLNDPIPRYTLEKSEFPGIRDDVIRAGT